MSTKIHDASGYTYTRLPIGPAGSQLFRIRGGPGGNLGPTHRVQAWSYLGWNEIGEFPGTGDRDDQSLLCASCPDAIRRGDHLLSGDRS